MLDVAFSSFVLRRSSVATGDGTMLTIDDIAPDRATYRPGQAASVTVTLTNDGGAALSGRFMLVLSHLAQSVMLLEQAVQVGPDATATVTFSLTPPAASLRGYGLDVTLVDADGHVLAEGSGALDVLE